MIKLVYLWNPLKQCPISNYDFTAFDAVHLQKLNRTFLINNELNDENLHKNHLTQLLIVWTVFFLSTEHYKFNKALQNTLTHWTLYYSYAKACQHANSSTPVTHHEKSVSITRSCVRPNIWHTILHNWQWSEY